MQSVAGRDARDTGAERCGPEIAVRILSESADQAAMQSRITLSEFVKTNAIEADEAVLGAKPEETIASLEDGIDGRLKPTLFLAPTAMRVLGERFTGIERVRGGRQEREQKSAQEGPHDLIVSDGEAFGPTKNLCQMA